MIFLVLELVDFSCVIVSGDKVMVVCVNGVGFKFV